MSDRKADQEHVLTVDVSLASEAAFSIDASRRIKSWNAAAERLVGYDQAEVLGRSCSEVLKLCPLSGNGSCQSHCSAISNARRGRGTDSFQAAVQTRSGAMKPVDVCTLIARTATGESRVVHIMREADVQSIIPVNSLTARRQEGLIRPSLTRRELEVLKLLAAGYSTEEVANTLSISPITARNHVSSVIEKLEVRTRLQAVVTASQLGLL